MTEITVLPFLRKFEFSQVLQVMPFGLKNAAQIFQRKMDKILSDYSDFIIVYIVDVLICYDDEKDHVKHLNIFIILCKEHG